MAKLRIIELSGVKYNGDYLRSVTEERALIVLRGLHDVSQIRNAWKQANGLTERNYAKPSASNGSPKVSTETKKPRARKKPSSKSQNKDSK